MIILYYLACVYKKIIQNIKNKIKKLHIYSMKRVDTLYSPY